MLGSEYGGWAVPRSMLPEIHVALAFGVGTDASFDLALIEATGCVVHAFDPTPLACSWVRSQNWRREFIFHPLALSDKDQPISLRRPDIEGHVSFYTTSEQDYGNETVQFPAECMNTITKRLAIEEVDICKLDIEGAEFAVLELISDWTILPKILLVEFHHSQNGRRGIQRTLRCIKAIKNVGYQNYYVSRTGREFGFAYRNVTKLEKQQCLKLDR